MSDATFSAPTGPTVGLQGYNLRRGVGELYPETILRLLQHVRKVAAGRRKSPRAPLKKDADMKVMLVRDNLDTLLASVTQIFAQAGTPEEREELLKKSFGECGEALTAEVEEVLAKRAPAEDDEDGLYKGLGCVGRVARLVEALAAQTRAIQEGGFGGDMSKADDPASPTVAQLLDGALHLGELALREAVNEHVSAYDGGDLAEGERIVSVPSALDPENPDAVFVLKTDLPEDLAKFATDPDGLDEMRVDVSIDLALQAGVPVRRLEKALGLTGLAKAYGLEGLAKAEDGEEDDEEDMPPGEGDGEGEGGDGGDEMPPAPGGQPSPDEQNQSPFDVLGRLLAATMIQAAHCQDLYEGGADGGDEEQPPADEGEGGGEEGEGGGGRMPPQFRKADGAGALRKGAEGGGQSADDLAKVVAAGMDQMNKGLAGVTDLLRKMADQPAAPKGALMAVAVPKEQDGLAKVADASGDPKDVKGPDGYSESDLAKMDPEARALIEIKRSYQAR